MRRTERGIVLPVVLLCLLGLGALSTAALVIVRSELVADRAGHRSLRELADAERLLRGSPPTPKGGFDRYVTDLRSGFRLVEVRPRAFGLSHFGVEWVLDPDSVVARLPRALQASGTLPSEGVELLDGCTITGSGALMAAGEPSLDAEGVPTSSPRLGILGVAELLALPGSDLPEPGLLPAPSDPEVTRLRPANFSIRGGEGSGILVAAGDLTLEGSAVFRGLLVVRGTLVLRGAARVEGLALVGGEARVFDSAQILGCLDHVLESLRGPAMARGHPLPAGMALGRY